MSKTTIKERLESTKESLPYSVFSRSQQITLVVITAFTAMLSPLTANIYLPALNRIEQDLKISTEHVNLTVTVYMIFQAISPAFWAPLADSIGRRPVLLSTLVVYCAACVGLGLTPNYVCLLVLRMVQAFGSSSVIAVGAGVIGDIADSQKRGSYFGVYSIGQLSGPVYGPVIGGVISEKLGWRWIFWILLILGASSLLLVGFFSPETLRSLVGNGSGYANPTPWQWIKHGRNIPARQPRAPWLFWAPFRCLLAVDVLILLLYNGIHYAGYYAYLSSTTKQFSIHFPYLSELQIGICFLSQGVGTILGSFVRGRVLDRDYRAIRRWVEAQPEPQIPFPLLRARFRSLWPNFLAAQITTLFYGWALFWGAPLPAVLALQFLVGFGCSAIMTTTQTLLIDLYPAKGASVTASNNLVRCILGAIVTICIDPGIQGVGVGWMFTILGLLMILSNMAIPILFKYGPEWIHRRSLDAQNNNK
ncbi:major facilitator superfamily domain-containing protein [Sporodiniella umbellata]|nr:major facilitator superfamily domain-containing protein [Sporodiniella umbellata]